MKKSSFVIAIIIAVICIVGLPLFIDWAIIGNNFPSNISNSDWVGFLGGYVGAIIGCIISLVGILWTINFSREQNRTDRELQIRPYFDIRYLPSCNTLPQGVLWLGYVDIIEQDEIGADSQRVEQGLLFLKNVGNGPATNIDVKVSLEDILVKHDEDFTNRNIKVTTNSVRQGEEHAVSIYVYNNRIAPTEEDIIYSEDGIWDYNPFQFPIPKPYIIKLQICYRDLLGNAFIQELKLTANYSMRHTEGKGCKFTCDVFIKEIDAPKRVQEK